MARSNQGLHDAVVEEDAGRELELAAHLVEQVVDVEAAARICVHADQNLELLLGGGFALGGHELRHLVGGAVAAGAGEGVGEGVVGGEGVTVALLLAGPVEEAGGDGGVRLELEDLSHQLRRDPAELAEVGEHGGAPAAVAAEGVADVAGDGGEGLGGGGGGRRKP